MAAFLRCVIVCALVACALGHAVLRSPKALNPNPTTTNPCGVSSYPANPVPVITWRAGTSTKVIFELVAGDGGSEVYGYLHDDGSTAFTKDETKLMTGQMANGLQSYEYTFTVPNVACNPICVFRMATNTGWNSCAYVNISSCDSCPPPTPPPPTCKTATGLKFCTGLNGKNVLVPDDTTIATLESNAVDAYNLYINNTKVFSFGNTTDCQKTFKDFICKENLVPCPGSGATISSIANCGRTCENLDKTCGLTEAHSLLYQCKTYPKCLDETGAASALSVYAALAFAAVALVFVL